MEHAKMYAIIANGSHQYRVEEGLVFEVERMDLPEGAETVEFDTVLFVGGMEDGPKVGRPTVEGAKVTAEIIDEIKGNKITIIKHHKRKNYARKQGHRQKYLQLRVSKIEA